MKQNIFMRKCCAGILAISSVLASCSFTTATTAVTASAATLVGDVNSDGSVSIADAASLQKYLLKKSTLNQASSKNADMNSDGKVNVIDLALLKAQILAGNPVSSNVIHLLGTSIQAEGTGVTVNGTTVTITKSGSYTVDGSMTVDSQIIVRTDDTDTEAVELTLDGVSMTNSTDLPCLLVENADKTKVTFSGENTLTSTFDETNTNENAVILAKDDITFTKNSTGTLNVVSNSHLGISCNNDIKINGGTLNVTTASETNDADGIKAKQTVEISGGTVTVDSTNDGIKSTKADVTVSGGTVSIKAGADAIQGETNVAVSDGTVVASGDRGITSAATLTITGGSVLATATDNQSTYVTNASTQNIVTLDYAAEHKKAEVITIGESSFTANKKYSYALVSGSAIASNSTSVYTNGTQMMANEAKDGVFNTSAAVAKFTGVTELTGGSTIDTSTTDTTATAIVYSNSSVTLKNASGATLLSADNVTVNGTTATVTKPTEEIDVSGSCSAGQLVVDVDKTTYADGTVTLVLDGLTLSNTTTSPVYIAAIGDEATISIKNGTTNTISDGTNYTNADSAQGAIYACDDLKIKGKGSLTVNGNQADGIVCKNDLKIWNGNLTVKAVDDCIRGKDSVKIGDPDDTDYSNLVINATSTAGDGIKSSNATDAGEGAVTINGGTVTVNAYSDGIQGEQDVTINGGTIDITTTGTSGSGTDNSAKGIKSVGLYDSAGTTLQSGGTLTVNGGMITIDSKDDSLHSGGNTTLNAGKIKITSGDDAVHSDSSLYVGGTTAGTDYTSLEVYVTACYEGFEAAYIYQNNGNIYIISSDDGFNAAGGADSSGSGNSSSGWNQGGGWNMGGGGMGGSSYGEMYLNGGIVSVNTSFNDADGFDSNGPITFNGGYYFGNGGDSFDCGDGYSITYNGGYAFGGLGMNGGNGSSYDMSTQMVFTSSDGTVLASSMSGSSMTYAYGDSSVLAYSGAQITGGTNISTLGEPAVYVSGTASGGTSKTLGSSGGSSQWGGQGGWGGFGG